VIITPVDHSRLQAFKPAKEQQTQAVKLAHKVSGKSNRNGVLLI
jgi:hypothetical protein